MMTLFVEQPWLGYVPPPKLVPYNSTKESSMTVFLSFTLLQKGDGFPFAYTIKSILIVQFSWQPVFRQPYQTREFHYYNMFGSLQMQSKVLQCIAQLLHYNPFHYSALQELAVQCSIVLHIAVQWNTVYYMTVWEICSTVQYSAVQCSTVQYSAVQKFYSTVQCSTLQYYLDGKS